MWDWAVALLLIAFGGALGLVGLVVADSASISLQQLFLHLFLDLFAVGWFNLALLGTLWAYLSDHASLPRWLPSQSLAILVAPTFLLGVSPILISNLLFWVAATANLGAALLLVFHLRALWQFRECLPKMAWFGFAILTVHIVSTLFVMWPGFWRWSAGTQLRIFFLHNFLLGWVSSALLGIILVRFGWDKQPTAWFTTANWIGGIVIMLLALLGIGFVQFISVAIGTWLWVAAWGSILPALAALFVLVQSLLAFRSVEKNH